MNKHGFTLIELLAVIIMLAIILIITMPIVSSIIYNARLSSFVANEKMMIWASKNYLGTNENYLPVNIGDTIEIKLSLLQEQGLISNIQDPWNNNDTCGGYILVTKIGTNTYDYTPYLRCQSDYKIDSYKISSGISTHLGERT
jgi:type IV pilus assembly protein PilA